MALPEDFGKIRVRRTIYEQAQAVEKEAARKDGSEGLGLAQARWEECQNNGDKAGSVYWHEVWSYLMEVYCTDKTEIEFIED